MIAVKTLDINSDIILSLPVVSISLVIRQSFVTRSEQGARRVFILNIYIRLTIESASRSIYKWYPQPEGHSGILYIVILDIVMLDVVVLAG
jgi:hypothetical protein